MTSGSRTQVCCATGVLGVAMLAAAIDDGLLAPVDRRVLLVANTADLPEVTASPLDVPGFDVLARRFDDVVDWNAFLAPLHPAAWAPPAPELPLLGRLVRRALGLDAGAVDLVVDSLDAAPGRSLADLVPDAPITIVCDSLRAWAPPARPLTGEQAGRTTRLLHLPVLADVRVRLLDDALTAPACAPVPAAGLRAVLAELDATRMPADAALLVGDRDTDGSGAGSGGVASPAELLRRIAAHGLRRAVLVPHPAGGPQDHRALLRLAGELGVTLDITTDGLPAEAVLAGSRPALVVGGLGTALVVAREFSVPVACVGAEQALARSARGPEHVSVAIVHAAVHALGADGTLTARDLPPGGLDAVIRSATAGPAPVRVARPRTYLARRALRGLRRVARSGR